MKVKLQRIAVVEEATLDIPESCPECGADLTETNAITENRVCRTQTFSHLDRKGKGADVVATDSEDRDVTWYATEWLRCARCDTDLVAAARQKPPCASCTNPTELITCAENGVVGFECSKCGRFEAHQG